MIRKEEEEKDEWVDSPRAMGTDEKEEEQTQKEAISRLNLRKESEIDETCEKIEKDIHFCYRISCNALLSTKKGSTEEIQLKFATTAEIFQPAIEEKELENNCPKQCIIYLNVFRHKKCPKPTGKHAKEWSEIPIIISRFQYQEGCQLIRISGDVAINWDVVHEIVKPGNELWGILNQKILIQVQNLLESTWNVIFLKLKNRSRNPLHYYMLDRESYTVKEGYKDAKNSRVVPDSVKVCDLDHNDNQNEEGEHTSQEDKPTSKHNSMPDSSNGDPLNKQVDLEFNDIADVTDNNQENGANATELPNKPHADRCIREGDHRISTDISHKDSSDEEATREEESFGTSNFIKKLDSPGTAGKKIGIKSQKLFEDTIEINLHVPFDITDLNNEVEVLLSQNILKVNYLNQFKSISTLSITLDRHCDPSKSSVKFNRRSGELKVRAALTLDYEIDFEDCSLD